jgi:hypothetical protein
MKNGVPDLRGILDRVVVLERQRSREKRTAAATLIALAALLMIGQASPKGRILEAEQFDLKDANGNTRAKLSVDPVFGVGLLLLDGRGNVRVELDEGENNTPQLVFRSRGGKPQVVLDIRSPGVPGLHMFDADGAERASFGLSATSPDGTPGLRLTDIDGRATVSIMAMRNLPVLTLKGTGREGPLDLSLHLKPDGPGLWLYDMNGKPLKGVLWSPP